MRGAGGAGCGGRSRLHATSQRARTGAKRERKRTRGWYRATLSVGGGFDGDVAGGLAVHAAEPFDPRITDLPAVHAGQHVPVDLAGREAVRAADVVTRAGAIAVEDRERGREHVVLELLVHADLQGRLAGAVHPEEAARAADR